MKNLAKLVMMLAVVVFAASCGDSAQNAASVVNASELDNHRGEATSFESVDRFSLADVDVNLEAMETIQMEEMDAASADAAALMSYNQSLMSAEKEAQLLDVNFAMSDEPVANGVFVFGIESPNAKGLTMQMFDEEGFQMAAHNQFEVTEGQNYKALNVNAMESGSYVFRLKDEEGKELTRSVTIEHK